jgi:predicted nucleic acid-binding protein
MKNVFVDTSAFYAILDPEDPFHKTATDGFERAASEGWTLWTT